jgi:Cu+-exporting ATPase
MSSHAASHAHGDESATGSAVVDPVCGMTIDRADSVGEHEYRGTTYYFCNPHCLEQFREDPERFLANPAEPGSHASRAGVARDAEYTCPMDPEVRQIGPGPCPKCGMALEPVLAAPATRTEWTCPMHPEIVRDQPGACPICGMALEPRLVTLAEANPELDDMTRRFRASLILVAPLLAMMVADLIPGQPLAHRLGHRTMAWLQLALATPIVLWGRRRHFRSPSASTARSASTSRRPR